MQYYLTYPSPRPRPQAIPMAVYRRQMLLAQWRPRILFLLFALAMYQLSASPWRVWHPLDYALTTSPADRAAEWMAGARPTTSDLRPELVGVQADTDDLLASPPSVAGSGWANIKGVGGTPVTNLELAISLVDGSVIEPGGRFSFDDTARTWDFNEDPRYLMGAATSAYGVIMMRGGGVCWLSTALWRAALAAGLQTEFRENHYGLVAMLGGGLDATNTLVLRNDSNVPVTIRAWTDEDNVYVSLLADGDLGRTGSIRGPERIGYGHYVAYQDITWADGRTTTSEFDSRYSW